MKLDTHIEILARKHTAEQLALQHTIEALQDAAEVIPDLPIPYGLSGSAGRLLWYRERTPAQMIDDLRKVASSRLQVVDQAVGETYRGGLQIRRSVCHQFGRALELSLTTQHANGAMLCWTTSSPLRMPRAGTVFPEISFNPRTRPAGKIASVSADPLLRTVLADYRSSIRYATQWNSTLGWCVARDGNVMHRLDELAEVLQSLAP